MNALKPLTVAALVLGLASVALAAEPKRNLAVSKAAVPATEQRVALVIGNSAYKEAPLRNPVNDANDIAATLKGLGFAVTLKTNANQKQMKQALREFGLTLKKGGVGLFYYAGHGIQSRGRNYLVPVGANVESEAELEDESVDANLVLSYMEDAQNRVNIVVMDACRNNPFARSFRSASRGLAQMEAARGSFIAYATAPGSVAADGSGRNGVYTKHLLASLKRPDTDMEKVFKRAHAAVMEETNGKQTPWVSSSLTGDFYFNPSATPGHAGAAPAAAVRVQTPEEIEQELWNAVKGSRDRREFEDYLKQYPKGRFAPLASQKLKALASAPAPQKKPETVASLAPLPATKPKPEPAAVAGKVWKEPTTGMEFVWIPKGCYTMGSPASESGRSGDEHPHQVCIEGYWLSKYEVTNTQYRMFKPAHDSGNYEGNNLNGDGQPVVEVSWNDAVAYAEWLSQKTGKRFKLPTEAEWEYAARAGTQTARYWGDEDSQLCRHANIADRTSKVAFNSFTWAYDGCDDGYKVSAPVGRFAPNNFGLYDMLGNVWEWTSSPYDAAYAGGEKRAAALSEGGTRVLRGGSWDGRPGTARAAGRDSGTPDARNFALGLRLARSP